MCYPKSHPAGRNSGFWQNSLFASSQLGGGGGACRDPMEYRSVQVLKDVPCILQPAVPSVEGKMQRLQVPTAGWDELSDQSLMHFIKSLHHQLREQFLVVFAFRLAVDSCTC
jgi:hypothetical protein